MACFFPKNHRILTFATILLSPFKLFQLYEDSDALRSTFISVYCDITEIYEIDSLSKEIFALILQPRKRRVLGGKAGCLNIFQNSRVNFLIQRIKNF